MNLHQRVAGNWRFTFKRSGGQTQFSVPLSLHAADEGGWKRATPGSRPISRERPRWRMAVSLRTFALHYLHRAGRTPAKVVKQLQLEVARRALEDGDPFAKRCRFLDAKRMRRVFPTPARHQPD